MNNLRRLVRQPSLAAVAVRRLFPLRAYTADAECSHIIKSWSSGGLPRLSIAELFPGIAESTAGIVLRKPEARTIGWSLDFPELVHVVSVMRFTGALRILEIGTFDGFTALNLAANLNGGQVHTLDLPPEVQASQYRQSGISNAISGNVVGSKYRETPEAARIVQLFGDSTKLDWSTLGGAFDMILIDGCHDYPFVVSDSRNALQHISPGGTIFWHDYGQCVDVSRACDELSATHPVRAVKGTRLACLRMR